MASLIKAKATLIASPTHPKLSEWGYLPQEGLVDLFRMKTDFATDNSAPEGVAMTNQATASGELVASWSGGIATVPDTQAAGQYHMYRLNGVASGLERTFAVLFKVPDKSRQQTLFSPLGGGASLMLGFSGVDVNFNDGANQIVTMDTHTAGVWQSVVMVTDALGVRLSLNGGPIRALSWSDYDAVPAAGTQTRFGRNSNNFSPYGEFALIAQHDRALSNTHLQAFARGLSTFALVVKGKTIGAA